MSNGQQLLRYLKNTSGSGGVELVLRIPQFESYFLRPIPTRSDFLNPDDVVCLTEWRNRNAYSFLTEFLATESRTSTWLSHSVHDDPGKILFMIENKLGSPIGHMGLSSTDWKLSYVEVDAVVRGAASEKGLMSAALLSLIEWARNQLEIKNIGVRVLSDNPALTFYEKIGFTERRRVPLRKETYDSFNLWVEDEFMSSPSRHLVHYHWDK